MRAYDRTYPFAWLGILARVAPSVDELVYACGERGFAMHSMRSPEVSRLYIQVDPGEDLAAWPDDRVWAELQARLAYPGWSLAEGPVVEKGITPMRSFVVEPMRAGRLFLAGDAAHIVPPTGAKGLNLAVADVAFLADALISWYAKGDEDGLDGYGARCAARVWRVQDFSTTMTTLLHLDPGDDPFGRRLQAARQAEVVRSRDVAANLAENYVGLPLHTSFA
jgi:p-hydroxybenzoate 3-monooxygenase